MAPGLEALEKMRVFYTEKGIDILKDAVGIAGVSLHYLLRGCVEPGAELYSACKEAYEMLKEAVVGGPSLVFTRYHEVGVTKIRSHQITEPRLCKNIVGYDANALYLSTMLRDMPCGDGRVVHYNNKFSTKGMSKKQNEITWQRFRSALDGSKDMATNIDFCMNNGRIVTYEQQKLGLSAYYDKRWVLEDGIRTEPIEFHS